MGSRPHFPVTVALDPARSAATDDGMIPEYPRLTHLDSTGAAHMVDVAAKPVQRREATAEGWLRAATASVDLLRAQGLKKGDALAVARIAGIQAAKLTSTLIPLCHALPLSSVEVQFDLQATGVRVTATARTTAQTGVEMEALTAVTVAALTLYDMMKAVDKGMVIEGITLLSKTKTDLA
jgi:cyclic pyranopterin monophosphate synthase